MNQQVNQKMDGKKTFHQKKENFPLRVLPLTPTSKDRAKERRLLVSDPETGEEVGWIVESLDRPPAPKEWVKIYKRMAMEIAKTTAFSAQTRVFHYLFYHIQFGNFVGVTIQEIHEDLGVSRPTVRAAIRKMLDAKLIHEEKYRGVRGYRLNPNYMHLGNPRDRAMRMQQWNERLAEKRQKDEVGRQAAS